MWEEAKRHLAATPAAGHDSQIASARHISSKPAHLHAAGH